MISPAEASLFLNRNVVCVHIDGGRQQFVTGWLVSVTDNNIMLQDTAGRCLISLSSIVKIRERSGGRKL